MVNPCNLHRFGARNTATTTAAAAAGESREGREGSGWAATSETGPNDASRVQWALGTPHIFFFFPSRFLYTHYIILGSLYLRKVRGGSRCYNFLTSFPFFLSILFSL